jgi:CRP/FNR family cyclic AMP-dependent transcriptional regulator
VDKSILLFRNYLAQCNDFTKEEEDFIISKFEYKKIAKKTLLLQPGEVCSFEAFVLKGLGISYMVNESGNKTVLSFASENWWLSDIDSFHDERESKMFIEILEDTELLMINLKTKAELLLKVPKLERMYRLLVQRHLIHFQQRFYSNIALDGKERYHNFLSQMHP